MNANDKAKSPKAKCHYILCPAFSLLISPQKMQFRFYHLVISMCTYAMQT